MVNRTWARKRLIILNTILIQIRIFVILIWYMYMTFLRHHQLSREQRANKRYSMTSKVPYQINHIRDLVGISDEICRHNLRMPRSAFHRLCFLLENVSGLRPNKSVSVEEQVAMFLSILAHHKKNVTLQTDFKRSGHTVSIYFNRVLLSVLKLYPLLVITPEPVPEGSNDHRWQHFKVLLKRFLTSIILQHLKFFHQFRIYLGVSWGLGWNLHPSPSP